jgi:hypothetical protein
LYIAKLKKKYGFISRSNKENGLSLGDSYGYLLNDARGMGLDSGKMMIVFLLTPDTRSVLRIL